MKSEKLFGTIFLPHKRDEPITGVWLVMNDNSITLEVPRYFAGDDYWDIIHGEFTGLDEVTFVRCYAGGSSTGAGGSHTNILVSYLIKGAHFNTKDEMVFDKVHLTCPALVGWAIEKTGIKSADGLTIVIPDTETLSRSVIGGVSIEMKLWYRRQYGSKKANAEQECYVDISSDQPLDLDALSGYMSHSKKFILFLTDKNPEYSAYTLFKGEDSFKLVNTTENLREDKFSQGIRINYSRVKDNLGHAMERWFELKELYSVIDFLLERHYNPDISPHGFFISICTAIEIYEGNKVEPIVEEAARANRNSIASLIQDEELKKWFLKKTQSWERPKVQKLQELKPIITELITGIFNITPDDFIQKVIDTRNDIVHRGSYKNSFTSTELFLVTKVLEFSLKLRILELVGFDTGKKPDSLLDNAKSAIKILARMNKISAGN